MADDSLLVNHVSQMWNSLYLRLQLLNQRLIEAGIGAVTPPSGIVT